jgi:hypothetical protein
MALRPDLAFHFYRPALQAQVTVSSTPNCATPTIVLLALDLLVFRKAHVLKASDEKSARAKAIVEEKEKALKLKLTNKLRSSVNSPPEAPAVLPTAESPSPKSIPEDTSELMSLDPPVPAAGESISTVSLESKVRGSL